MFTTASNFTNKTSSPESCGQSTEPVRQIFMVIILAIIFVVGMLGNGLAVIVIALSKKLRTKTSNIFIVSLAFTDLGMIIFTLPFRIDQNTSDDLNFCYDVNVCRMTTITDILFQICSVTHLFAIAIERFFAITQPFLYERLVTRKATYICVACVWLYSVVWTGLGMFNWKDPSKTVIIHKPNVICYPLNKLYFTVLYSAVFLIPLVIMAFMYTLILKVAYKQAKVIASLHPRCQNGEEDKKDKGNLRELRATKVLVIVYGTFVVCMLPLIIIGLMRSWCKDCFSVLSRETSADVLRPFVEILPPLNSCLNPFIYILFSKQFRKGSKLLLWKILGREKRYLHNDSDCRSFPRVHSPQVKSAGGPRRCITETFELSSSGTGEK